MDIFLFFPKQTLTQQSVIEGGLVTPAGVAVDWLNRKLYWADARSNGASVIEVAEMEAGGGGGGKRHRMVLLAGGIESPRDMVVHPTAG